jgi:putative two-component system response regulator
MHKHLKREYQTETGAPFNDSLTDLFNHGFFQIVLDREVNRSDRYGESLTLALIDLDSFADYNRRRGSVEGDRVLKEIASLIMKNIRKIDLAARYSGDVLAIILPKSEIKSALVALERIRKAVSILPEGTPTVSVGLASCPKDATESENLITKAEEALFQAKIRGKNRTCFFEKKPASATDGSPRILVVDDDPINVELLEDLLHPLKYEVLKAFNGEEALSIAKKIDLDLILLDIMMAGMDGYEVCRRLRGSEETRLIPVVMVTGLDDIEAKIKGIEAGADDFLTKPPNKMELLARTKSLIKLKISNNSLASIENVLFSIANAVEAKDAYTQGHVERVSNLAVTLGQKIGLSKREVEALRFGGVLHDLGKIVVPRDILNKPGPLDPEERKIIETHPRVSANICAPLKKNLGAAFEAILYHHERLDGSGYPDGLKGESIPAVARVLAVVDVYDALLTDRPYRKALPRKKAFEILRKEAKEGKLDKEVIDRLIDSLNR